MDWHFLTPDAFVFSTLLNPSADHTEHTDFENSFAFEVLQLGHVEQGVTQIPEVI